MKYLQIRLMLFLLVLLQISCHDISQTGKVLQKDRDSLTAAIKDSLIRNDLWERYSYEERQGKQLFEQYCVVCHGQNGEGDGFNAYNLSPRPHSLSDSTYTKTLSNETLAETIAFGGKSVNKSVLMPAYQNTLSKIQISNIVAYLETFTQHISNQR